MEHELVTGNNTAECDKRISSLVVTIFDFSLPDTPDTWCVIATSPVGWLNSGNVVIDIKIVLVSCLKVDIIDNMSGVIFVMTVW